MFMNMLTCNKFVNFVNSLKNKKSIIALIVFGSYARGDYTNNSDLDICIITNKFINNADFDYPDREDGFDVHFFYSLPLDIQFKVFSEGKVVLVNDKKKYDIVRKRIIREYRGFDYKREKYSKLLLERY